MTEVNTLQTYSVTKDLVHVLRLHSQASHAFSKKTFTLVFCTSFEAFLLVCGCHDPALVAFMHSNPKQKAPPFLASLPPAARLMPRLTMRCGFISDLVSTRRPLCVSRNLSRGSTTSCHAPFLHAQHSCLTPIGTRTGRTPQFGGTKQKQRATQLKLTCRWNILGSIIRCM